MLHALCTCDTTSAIFGKETCCEMVQQCLDQIKDIWMDPAGGGKAGHQLFLNMYGEKKKLRYKKVLGYGSQGRSIA